MFSMILFTTDDLNFFLGLPILRQAIFGHKNHLCITCKRYLRVHHLILVLCNPWHQVRVHPLTSFDVCLFSDSIKAVLYLARIRHFDCGWQFPPQFPRDLRGAQPFPHTRLHYALDLLGESLRWWHSWKFSVFMVPTLLQSHEETCILVVKNPCAITTTRPTTSPGEAATVCGYNLRKSILCASFRHLLSVHPCIQILLGLYMCHRFPFLAFSRPQWTCSFWDLFWHS